MKEKLMNSIINEQIGTGKKFRMASINAYVRRGGLVTLGSVHIVEPKITMNDESIILRGKDVKMTVILDTVARMEVNDMGIMADIDNKELTWNLALFY